VEKKKGGVGGNKRYLSRGGPVVIEAEGRTRQASSFTWLGGKEEILEKKNWEVREKREFEEVPQQSRNSP